MIRIAKITGIVILAGALVTGCSTPGGVLQDDATAFTTGELYTHFSEKTQIREGGGIYYTEYGTLTNLADGKREEGTWSSHDGGKLCRHFDNMEDPPCETYYYNGEVVSMVDASQKTTLAPKLVGGNKLDFLETGAERKDYTREQTIALISGKTAFWENNNGAYYDPSGKLITKWDGIVETGKWTVNDKGRVCWHISSWGDGPCEGYFEGAEGLMAIYKGKESLAVEHREGNQLDSM